MSEPMSIGLWLIRFICDKWPRTWWPRRPPVFTEVATGVYAPPHGEFVTSSVEQNFDKICSEYPGAVPVIRWVLVNDQDVSLTLSWMHIYLGNHKYIQPPDCVQNPTFPCGVPARSQIVVRAPLEWISLTLKEGGWSGIGQIRGQFEDHAKRVYNTRAVLFPIEEWRSVRIVAGKLTRYEEKTPMRSLAEAEASLLKDHLSKLSDARRSGFEATDRAILNLSSAGLGISLTVLRLMKLTVPWSVGGLLIPSWVCFCIAIIGTLFSFRVSIKDQDEEIEKNKRAIRDRAIDELEYLKENRYRKWTGWLNTVSLTSFIIAIVLTAAFVIANTWPREGDLNDARRSNSCQKWDSFSGEPDRAQEGNSIRSIAPSSEHESRRTALGQRSARNGTGSSSGARSGTGSSSGARGGTRTSTGAVAGLEWSGTIGGRQLR